MANYSSLYIYHPIKDFKKEDQEYFQKYYEAEKASRKYWVKEGDGRVWKGKTSEDNFIADFIGLPPADENDKHGWDRIKKRAHIQLNPQTKEILINPWGKDHIALGNLILDFKKERRNVVPDSWKIASMTGEVDAGAYFIGEDRMQPICYAGVFTPLLEAINNVNRYINAVRNLPVSNKLSLWTHLAQFCGRVEELGEWLGLHYLLSYEPEKCFVEISWGEVAMFYPSEEEIQEAADTKNFIKYVEDIEKAISLEGALKIVVEDPQDAKVETIDVVDRVRRMHPFSQFRQGTNEKEVEK